VNTGPAAKRLETLKRLLAHAHERLALEIGFVLWDGSTVPAQLAPDALAVSIADEGVVAGLVRRPNVSTLANLWVSGRLDIRNGSIFDLVERRPKVRTREIRKSLDKRLLLETAARFLLVSRGGPWPLETVPDDKPSSGSATENKQNIYYHYDFANAFYQLFLDPEMLYTSAYFSHWGEDLATAQRNKLELICRKLQLKAGETMLDIGCGWGALVCYAAQNYGVKAHGVTLSEQQQAFAAAKIARLGLGDRVKVELKNYAAVEGQFDKISQIEMVEHIGLKNHPDFYRQIHRMLKPDGFYVHQASARLAKKDDKTFHKKRPEVQALTKFVMPGVDFDYIGMTLTNLERYGFEVHDVECLREHHALTARIWHDALHAKREAAEREAGKVMTKLFLAYLAGCSIAFERNTSTVYQTLVSKRRRGPSGLPPTRAAWYR
jgi:cyclopropane-fatty-acyl-phospholipid synthase